jgi:DNA-binding NtrC family response regulator
MADLAQRASEHRILIVDDEPALLEELMESFIAAGWHVEHASNAMAAWEKLNADQSLTVLLSDIRMRGQDGLSLAKCVCDTRGASNPTEVVLLTGDGTADDAAEAARIGVFDFLSKPVSLKALLDSTERAYRSACDRRLKLARAREVVIGSRTRSQKRRLP